MKLGVTYETWKPVGKKERRGDRRQWRIKCAIFVRWRVEKSKSPQLKTVVNIPWLIKSPVENGGLSPVENGGLSQLRNPPQFQPSVWWCRISQPQVHEVSSEHIGEVSSPWFPCCEKNRSWGLWMFIPQLGKWWFNGGLMGFNQQNVGFYGIYPLVMTNSLRTWKWPIEFREFSPLIAWWIFPVRFVLTFTRG